MKTPAIEHVIGRMLMVGVRGDQIDSPAMRADLEACANTHIGGVILFDVDLPTRDAMNKAGSLDEQTLRTTRNIIDRMQVKALCADLRKRLGDHLLISVDQEGGAVRRLREVHGFSAVASARDRGEMSPDRRKKENTTLAVELAHVGFNVAFAPCVDVAIEEQNTVVVGNGRCYSSDPSLVTTGAAETSAALLREGVASCLKHFPGHGSSTGDTHHGMVDITRTYREEVEMQPYVKLIADRPAIVPMVMTGHLMHAGIDAEHPASLSWRHTADILRGRLGFEGVVITDSLDMGAITKRYGLAEACVLAVNAGADILLDANNAPGATRDCPAPVMHEAIARALRDGQIVGGEDRLRASWSRIKRLPDLYRSTRDPQFE